MANALPPIPYKTKMINKSGFLNEAWSKFMRELFNRVGGTGSDFDGDLITNVTTNSTNITDLQNRVSAIEQEPV